MTTTLVRAGNDSGNGAAAKELGFQNPRHRRLRFTALFCGLLGASRDPNLVASDRHPSLSVASAHLDLNLCRDRESQTMEMEVMDGGRYQCSIELPTHHQH